MCSYWGFLSVSTYKSHKSVICISFSVLIYGIEIVFPTVFLYLFICPRNKYWVPTICHTIPGAGTAQVSKTDSILVLLELIFSWPEGNKKPKSKCMIFQMMGNTVEKINPSKGKRKWDLKEFQQEGCYDDAAVEENFRKEGMSPPGTWQRHCREGEQQVQSLEPRSDQECLWATWKAASMAGAQWTRRSLGGAGPVEVEPLPQIFAGLVPSCVCSEFKNPFLSEAFRDHRHLCDCVWSFILAHTSLAGVLFICIVCRAFVVSAV